MVKNGEKMLNANLFDLIKPPDKLGEKGRENRPAKMAEKEKRFVINIWPLILWIYKKFKRKKKDD